MAKIYAFEGIVPVIDPTSYIHPDAVIIGDVIIGPQCYIGPCASLRGDVSRIIIGSGVNIQDTCVVHSFPDVDVIIEDNSHVGHGAILHGCVVEKNALIGMNSVVMDHAVIGENSFVAAMAFVKTGMLTGSNVLVGGMPAKVIRQLNDEEIQWKTKGTIFYHNLASRSILTMEEAVALISVEPNRKRIDNSKNQILTLGEVRK